MSVYNFDPLRGHQMLKEFSILSNVLLLICFSLSYFYNMYILKHVNPNFCHNNKLKKIKCTMKEVEDL
jgi:hypothetical protein